MGKKTKDSAISGLLSSSITVRKVRGQVVVTNRARPRPAPTDKQSVVQGKFLEASQYANQQLEIEESKALYTSGITSKKASAYVVAMSDYLNPPTVEWIDATDYRGVAGDPILVKAVDDFMVTRVKVIILDAQGAALESGDAGPDALRVNQWLYKAQVSNPALAGTTIRAIAYDRPGNTMTLDKVL